MATDQITLEVIKNGLASIADEMALVIARSAYSGVVRDTMDYSTALCDRRGQLVAQGLTLAVQLGTFPSVMRYICEEYGATAVPGDVFITNDPYGFGGQHLPDIYIIRPVFCDGELEGYAATMAHHSDVGGLTPGSIAVHATEIYQEGLRIPLLRLYEAGRENDTVFRIIEKNTRLPVHVLGDIRAQTAACRAGERGLAEILRKYGPKTARRYMDELQEQGECLMRAEIAGLPNGQYTFSDTIDGFGQDPEPLGIEVALTIEGDEITIDLGGSSPQVEAGLNCPVGMIFAACYCALRGICGRDIPNTEGYMRPIKIIAPPGSIVNPISPAACGARGVVGYRVYDAVMGALAQVVPNKVIAAGEGGPTLVAIGGYHQGRPFVMTEVMVGTWGARAAADGIEGVSNPLANLSNQPIELIEADQPVEVVQYGLVPDTGGAGEFRGGLAYVREFRLLADQAVLTIRSDRRFTCPWGLCGGEDGAPSANILKSRDVENDLLPMPMEALKLRRGDIFRHCSAGGGGFGNPVARDPNRVLADVVDGRISIAAARDKYGVLIDDAAIPCIDHDATRHWREQMSSRTIEDPKAETG